MELKMLNILKLYCYHELGGVWQSNAKKNIVCTTLFFLCTDLLINHCGLLGNKHKFVQKR